MKITPTLRPITLATSLATSLVLALATACAPASGSSSADPLAMRILSQAELEQAVLPQNDEKAVLLNFWATWCPPCLAEMPHLVELHGEWKDQGIRVQTIALDVQSPQGKVRTAEDIAAFMKRKNFKVPVIVPSAKDLTALAKKYNLTGAIPVTLVIDKHGEIVARQEGAASKKAFEKMVERAL